MSVGLAYCASESVNSLRIRDRSNKKAGYQPNSTLIVVMIVPAKPPIRPSMMFMVFTLYRVSVRVMSYSNTIDNHTSTKAVIRAKEDLLTIRHLVLRSDLLEFVELKCLLPTGVLDVVELVVSELYRVLRNTVGVLLFIFWVVGDA
jgi:hypothetical protein